MVYWLEDRTAFKNKTYKLINKIKINKHKTGQYTILNLFSSSLKRNAPVYIMYLKTLDTGFILNTVLVYIWIVLCKNVKTAT